jgi:DNA-binding SARP family transcriptional activator
VALGIEIELTGSVTIEQADGTRRSLSSAQGQVALARLTLERHGGTTRDQLADTLWPQGLPNTWASALRSVVSRVRAFLAPTLPAGGDPLVAQGGRYELRLPADVTVDVERAEGEIAEASEALAAGRFADARRLASSAAACLQAPFLPEQEGEWVAGVREHLAELLATGLETASLASSGLGDHGDALLLANEAIRRAPLRESAHRCRMTAHVTAGNRAEALRSYQELRRMLAEEVGVDPAPETEAAYLELLGSSPSAPAAADGKGGAAMGSTIPFVGREPELALLAGAWARAEEGTSRMVLLTGESGIGKTRLATEAAHRVAVGGGLVLCGRCDRGSIVPYQPFVEALGGYVASTPSDSLPALGPGVRDALAAVFPAVDGASDTAGTAGASRVELIVALTELMVRVASDRPALVVLDDIHLADGETLLLLRGLFRHSARASLLIVATASDEDVQPPDPFAEAIHDLDRDGWLDRLPLQGLQEADVRTLVRDVLVDVPPDRRPAAHRLIADTAGNTFLLLELLRSHLDDEARPRPAPGRLPVGVYEYAAARIAALEPSQRDLLRAAAVAGSSFELDLTARAAGLPPGPALDTLDALLAAGILTEVDPAPDAPQRGHRYRFTHDVLRRAVYDQVSEARRRNLHSQMADAIELLRSDDLVHYTPTLAHHRAAGAPPWGDQHAVQWSWRAAARARQRRTPNEVVRLCRQALDHVPPKDHALRAEALTNLGLAQNEAGQAGGEHALLDGAIHARRSGRLDIAARAALGLADVVTTRPQLQGEAAALIDDILARAMPRPATAKPARNGGRVGGLDRREPRSVDPLTLARLVAREAQLGGRAAASPDVGRSAMDALVAELRRLEGPDQLDRRLTLAAELLAVATAAGDAPRQIVAAHHRATAAEMAGETTIRDEALAALRGAAGDSNLSGDALLADQAVAAAVTEGRFADAAVAADLANTLAGTSDISDAGVRPAAGTMAARQMLVAAWLQVTPGPALDRLDDPVDQALVALLAGDRGRAHLVVRALATGAEPLPPGDDWLHAAGLLALAAVELDDPTTGEAVRALLTPYADLTCSAGYRSFVAPVSLHLGRLAFLVGDWAEAERHFTSALRQLAARRARPWIALTQLALARTLETRGRPGDRRWVAALRADARWIVGQLNLLPRCQNPSSARTQAGRQLSGASARSG